MTAVATRAGPPPSPPRKKAGLSDIKAHLIREILFDVEFYHWTPRIAAEKLGLALPDFYELRYGKRLERLSIERLMGCLIRNRHELKVNMV
jgi:Helix-turn-helix domain